ncbi:MAG: SMP-30/gluconolactonase/LRE family protein [Burkholderiales bacterium]|nr:SMP-30/gluconolactonase/LRE family protein [Burkholderiales bacterium]
MTVAHAPPFRLDLDSVTFTGSGLQRPECVLATRAGRLYVPDWRGGVVRIDPDGRQTMIGCAARKEDARFMPNGIALLRDGSLLFANLGPDGGIWRLHPDGRCDPWLTELDGTGLPAVNFVWLDDRERVWFTVMFRSHPGAGRRGFRSDIGDGYVGLADGISRPETARIVGENVVTANECRIGADGRHLYVNETFARRLCRFPLAADGTLGARETVAQFDDDTFPDGLTLDAEGAFWVTGVGANKIIRVRPDGAWHIVAEDLDPAHMSHVRAAIQAGTLGRPLLYDNHARVLPNITSLAFGGADLRTAYLGSVSGERLAIFRSPVAGAPPVHWMW